MQDKGENLSQEIDYPELWMLISKEPYLCERVGSNRCYRFKNCDVYELVDENGRTILMRQEKK